MKDMRSGCLIFGLLFSLLLGLVIPAVYGAAPVVLRRKGITDTRFNETAYFLLVPEGWKLKGSVVYAPPPHLSKTETIQVDDATETRGCALLKGETSFTYGTGPLWQMMMNSPGFDGTYNGLRVVPPMPAADFLQQMLLPQLQQQMPDLRIIEITPDRKAALMAQRNTEQSPHGLVIQQTGGRLEFDAVQFKACYRQKGRPFEMFGGLLLTRVVSSADGINLHYTWGLTTFFTLYAEEGRFQEAAPLLVTLLKSLRINPSWYVKSQNYRYRVWQQARDVQAEITGLLERNKRALLEKSVDRDQFSEYIRGTDVYKNPQTGDYFEVDSNYDHVWFNKNGDMIFCDSPNYAPNSDPRFNSQDWSQGIKAP